MRQKPADRVVKGMPVEESERFLRATLDGLAAHIAIVAEDGTILAVNRAWSEFAAANGGDPTKTGVGANYLAACDRASGNDRETAAAFAAGLRAVLDGRADRFERDYPCPGADRRQWFCGKITPFPDGDPPSAVVAHENITDRVLAEQHLRQSQRRLAEAQRIGRIGSWEWQVATGEVTWSDETFRLFGLEPGSRPPSYQLARDHVHPEDREAWEQAVTRAAAAGDHFEFEYLVLRADGATVWIQNQAEIERDPDGRPVAFYGTAQDVTARKTAELALRQSEARYRRILDTAQEGIWIADDAYRTTFANRRMAEILGCEPEEMLGRTAEDFMFAEDHEDHRRMKESRLTGRGQVYERRLRRRDGREVWTIVSAAPILDAEGRVEGGFAAVTDITERKRAQQALADSERRLRTILDAQEHHVVLHDLDLCIVWPNLATCRGAGLDREALIGRRCHEIWYGRQRVCVDCPVFDAIRTGTVQRAVRTRPDGRTWRLTGSPVTDAEGLNTGALLIAEDITERRALEEQFRHAQKMESIGVLAGGIAHDFNNILSAIIGYSDLCRMDKDLDPRLRENLEEVSGAGHRAKQLVSQILAFSRQVESEMAPVQVHLIVKEAVKLLKATLPATIVVRENIRSFAEVKADPSQLHQVVMNLCTNAYHALREEGGLLEVELVEVDLAAGDIDPAQPVVPGTFLRLTVRDTGSGMDAAVRGRIFDPYFTTKAKGEGTGLGLSVVYGIVQTLGGRITADSEPGRGSTFRVFLPKLAAGEARDEVQAPEEDLPPGTERILAVDDEPPIGKVVQRILEPLGYRVAVFTDPREALARFRRRPAEFDLVLTDMTMPGMTGDVLAGQLLRIRPELPVIVCTGFSEKIDPDRAAALGIRALVIKPIDRRTLARKVREVLDG